MDQWLVGGVSSLPTLGFGLPLSLFRLRWILFSFPMGYGEFLFLFSSDFLAVKSMIFRHLLKDTCTSVLFSVIIWYCSRLLRCCSNSVIDDQRMTITRLGGFLYLGRAWWSWSIFLVVFDGNWKPLVDICWKVFFGGTRAVSNGGFLFRVVALCWVFSVLYLFVRIFLLVFTIYYLIAALDQIFFYLMGRDSFSLDHYDDLQILFHAFGLCDCISCSYSCIYCFSLAV